MAEAEKKKIADLTFNVKDATDRLDEIDDRLKKLAKDSKEYAETIGKTLNNSISSDKVINVPKIKENLMTVDESVQKYGKNITNTLLKGQNQAEKAEQAKALAAEKAAQRQIESNNRVAKSTESLYDKITQYAKTYVIYQGFNVLKRAASETVEEMVEVQNQMVAIDRVLNESSLDIDHYRDRLIQLAYDYGNSFSNVADITLRLAQAGFDSEEAIALTEKTLLALNTAELNATQATDDMVAVMAQWGLMTGSATEQAQAYGDIIDKINKVADNFPTTSADIMDALKKVSSAFNIAGADIDETIATIVAAEKASQRGGKVIGTALANIVQQIRAEGKLDLAEQLGLNFFEDDAKTQFKPVIEIFQEMSDRMAELKAQGKESSVEMQNLLELFTVFRRNIGASLLGEMAGGEESTYMQVYKTSIDSVGYSLQENEKYMRTAKAAQEQFNTTLLQLKTSVWDNGLEDVFRSMLMLGNDVAKSIKFLTDTFGSVPTAISIAVMAFTSFNKNIQAVTYNAEANKIELNGLFKSIAEGTKAVRDANKGIIALADNQGVMITEAENGVKVFAKNTGEVIKYGASLAGTTLKTIGLQAATIALNAALSLGLSAGITLIISGLDKLIHAEENAAKKMQERVNESNDLLNTYEKERETLDDLINQYDELAKKTDRTPDDEMKIYEIQAQINSLIKDQKKSIDLVNGAYDETIKKLKQISAQERERSLKQAEITLRETQKQAEDYGDFGLESFRPAFEGFGIDLGKLQSEIMPNSIFQKSVDTLLKSTDYENTIRLLEEFKQKMEEAGDTSSDMYYKIIEDLKTMYGLQNNVNEATDTYNTLLAESKISEMFPEGTINNIEDYEAALEKINAIDFTGMDGLQEKMLLLLAQTFPDFAKEVSNVTEGIQVSSQEIEKLNEEVRQSLEDLTNLESGFASVYSAMDEFNNQGYISASTLQNLINNDLLQFFDIVNGKISINEAAMANAATATKAKAIEDLQAEAAAKIAAIAFGEEGTAASAAAGTTGTMTTKTNNVKNALAQMTPEALKAADAWQKLNAAMGADVEGLGEDQINRINTIMSNLSKSIQTINAVKIQGVSYSRTSARGSGGGSSGSSSAAANAAQREAEAAAKAAQKAEEDAYKERLKKFKDYITERERLETRWVKKQKELGLLSNNDYLYITQQRIERYKKYLDEVRKATWMNTEDRLELEKKYSEEIEDLQVDYFDYLQDKLKDEIDALEEANDKRIDLIKEEADARIAALKAVENENDRIRTKEEYEKRRQEHLDDISYWEQRTGREAQEALKEAKKNLQELDEEWEQQLEDWSIDDQIKAIEEERDAQVKAIQDAQQAEIDSMQAVYDAKVKMFTESGKIIYEGSVIQSQNLYNQYKSNFIDPISKDLAELNKATAPTTTTTAPATTTQQQYETYLIKSGDTLSKIASRYGTTVDKIMAANPYVKNRNLIYTGKTLQIPKFHEGGIFDGVAEGLALLKKGEVVLRPEWSNSLERMMKYFDNMSAGNTTNISNGPSITVSGDLVRIEASVRNQTDIDAIGKKVEKVLKDKFNIKK